MIILKSLIVFICLHFCIINAYATDGCNPVHCFRIFDALFSNDGGATCLKAGELLECASQCLNSSQNTFIKALNTLKGEMCSDSFKEDSMIVNKCISKQKYSILFCIYKYFEIEAENPLTDPKILTCRGSLDMGNCGQLSLPCTSRALYVEEILLKSFFDTFLEEDCYNIATSDVVYLKLKPLLSEEFKLLAECLDKNSPLVSRCLSKTDLPVKSNQDSCRSTNIFMDCIEILVQDKCRNYLDSFKDLSLSMKNKIDVSCSKTLLTEEVPLQITTTSSESSTSYYENNLLNHNTQDETTLDNKDTAISTENIVSKDKFNEEGLQNHNKSPNMNIFRTKINDPIDENGENVSMKTGDLPSNSSTGPIIIHKTTIINVSYRPKSQANCFCDFYVFIFMLCFSCFLYSDSIK